MGEAYSVPVYGSPEYFQKIASDYTTAQQPAIERGTAQLKNLLGGRGTYYGSALPNKYIQNVQQPFAQGLANTMNQQVTDYSKYMANLPLQEAQLTGYYKSPIGNQAAAPLPTLAQKTLEEQQRQFNVPYGGDIGSGLTTAQQEALRMQGLQIDKEAYAEVTKAISTMLPDVWDKMDPFQRNALVTALLTGTLASLTGK